MGRDEGEVRQRRQDSQRSLLPHEEPDDADWPYAQGNLDPLGKFIGLSVMVVSLSLVAYFRYQQYLRDIVITPLDAPLIVAANATGADVSPDRFWGTYRPHTYFGLKTRGPNSPVFGAMWFKQFTNKTTPPPLRHWCHQGDGLHGYRWLLHDGKSFGIQELEDGGFTVKTEWVKRAGGQHGGDWTARITMTPKCTGEEVVVSSMFYVALDGKGSVQPLFTNNVLTGVMGRTQQLGDFHLKFPVSRNKNQTTSHLVTHVSNLTQLTYAVKFSMKEKVWNKTTNSSYFTLGGQKMPPDSPGINFIVKEVIATLPLEMEMVFESGSFYSRPDTLTRDVFDAVLGNRVDGFSQKVSNVFQLEKKGFGEKEVHMAQAAISNMLGSIGYFYGSSLVQSDYNKVPVKYWPAPLFSSVHSRSLPSSHGSLWDAGFHTLVISHWDEGLALEIVGHWLDLINTEGWIPGELIFRDEACAKAQAKCVAQDNRMAAPPTLFLPLQRLIPRLMESQDPAEQQFLAALYPRLKAWYAWYNSSHTGSTMSVYRWRGQEDITVPQINSWTVASGLHDYLRASHPSDDDRHVDLRCWMALSTGVMAELARSLKNEQWKEYAATHQLLTDNALLDHLHWSEEGQQYSDYGLHTDEVKLEKQSSSQFQSGQPISDKAKHRVSISEPKYQFVNVFGYVSLFPFLLKIIDPQSPKLYKILTDLKDPSLLWSQYGLRSLAPTNRFYQLCKKEHNPASWCEDVWINMNFLTLAALHHYAHTDGPHSQLAGNIYSELRRNLVNNVATEFQRTGYLWEHYSDRTGEGQGSEPFSGGSALIVLIMGEIYS